MEHYEDISKYAKFISLQEENKSKKEEEDDDNVDNIQSSTPPAINLLSPSISAGPTPPGELRLEVKKGGIKIPTTVPKAVSSENPGSLGRLGLVSSTTDQYMRTGFPPQAGKTVKDVVAANTLRPQNQMQLAASYIPFSSGQELNENVKRMKSIVNRLLSAPEHKAEINKMKTEIRGE